MWDTASHCNWDCTVSRKTNRLFHLGNCITSQCPSLNAKRSGCKPTCTRVSTAGLTCLCEPLASLGPSEVNFTLLTVQNDVSWGLLAISKDIYNYPAVKRPQKGCTVFAEDQETVTTTNGWCHRHTESVRSGPSQPQDPEDLGRKGYCTKGNVEIRGLSSRHEEGRKAKRILFSKYNQTCPNSSQSDKQPFQNLKLIQLSPCLQGFLKGLLVKRGTIQGCTLTELVLPSHLFWQENLICFYVIKWLKVVFDWTLAIQWSWADWRTHSNASINSVCAEDNISLLKDGISISIWTLSTPMIIYLLISEAGFISPFRERKKKKKLWWYFKSYTPEKKKWVNYPQWSFTVRMETKITIPDSLWCTEGGDYITEL